MREKISKKIKSKTRRSINNPIVDKLIRFGYFTRGLLYIFIGILALELSLGFGGSLTNPKSILEVLPNKFLLRLIIIGLISYSFWGFVRLFYERNVSDKTSKF